MPGDHENVTLATLPTADTPAKSARATEQTFFRIGLLGCGGLLAIVAWDQSHWWRVKEDYGFGWLVPFFVAYVVRERWPQVQLRIAAGRRRVGRDQTPRWRAVLADGAAGIALIAAAGLFLLGAWHRAAAGSSFAATLALTAGAAGVTLATIFLLAPLATPVSRLRVTQTFLFPALVWLVSAPMLAIVESNLSVFLMRQVTTAVFFVFDSAGMLLEQRGNVLVLPTGNVGVAEACSGIRSLTGCLFAGSLLAAVFMPTLGRKLSLLAISLALAIVANLVRSLFLTGWAYRFGASSIEGTVHDVSGYAVLGLTIIGLLALLPRIGGKGK